MTDGTCPTWAARAFLRANHTCDVIPYLASVATEGVEIDFDSRRRCRYVIDPSDGMLVVAADPGLSQASLAMCFVPHLGPSESVCSLEARIESIDEHRDAACDRHRIYHGVESGRDAARCFVRLRIEALRYAGHFHDSLSLANPFASIEPALCKAANADRSRVAAFVERETGTRPEITPASPLVVGVDAWGIDVRARLGIIRVEFGREIANEGRLREEFARILALPTTP